MTGHGTNVIVRVEDDATVIGFARPDVIDLSYIRQVGEEMQELARTADPPHLVIDFEGVRYLSSAALGMLVALKELLSGRDGHICIANVADEVAGVFKLTKLPRIIPVYDTTNEALRSFRT